MTLEDFLFKQKMKISSLSAQMVFFLKFDNFQNNGPQTYPDPVLSPLRASRKVFSIFDNIGESGQYTTKWM